MFAAFLAVIAFLLVVTAALFIRRFRVRRAYEAHSILPEKLHELMEAGEVILLYDVRMPLDVLADLEIIPGAKRISPDEIRQNPALLPRDQDTVVYCTCPSAGTSQHIMRMARAVGYTRIRFLRGGLDAWRDAGYPVSAYDESFELDTPA